MTSKEVDAVNGLRQALDAALTDPASAAGLHLTYSRGHALSGITRFELDGTGRYELESNETMGRKAVEYPGALAESDRVALIRAMREHDLPATPSSTRNLGDDEIPVIVTLSSGPLSRELRVWHGDARQDPQFHAFETALLDAVRKLSDGVVVTSPD